MMQSPRAAGRLAAARREVEAWPANEAAWIVGAGLTAPRELVARAAASSGPRFGWQATTLDLLARRLAARRLAEQKRVAVAPGTLVAATTRVLTRMGDMEALGRYQAVADRPGLATAIASTWQELRLAGLEPTELLDTDPDLAQILTALERERAALRFADRAAVLAAASSALLRGDHTVPGGRRVALVDVPIRFAAEARLVEALARAADTMVATVPAGDAATARALGAVLERRDIDHPAADALARAQRHLFSDGTADQSGEDDSLRIISAPGESRECTELARLIVDTAREGVRFENMAIVLRAPTSYRVHVVEALARAGIPAHVARGTRRPDPAGRALLTLLECADEGLSARAFAEYLSLSVVPELGPDGAPPGQRPRFVPPDPLDTAEAPDDEPPPHGDETDPAIEGALRTPRRWERAIVDAAVIGGLDRWRRRLGGLDAELARRADALDDPDHPRRARLERDREALATLRAFALPVLERLEAMPAVATWQRWLDELGAIATCALRDPERILAVLAELEPLGPVGPVTLAEVRVALGPRLREILERPRGRRFGKVFVGTTDEIRGHSFDVVFVPGLAERVFPPRVTEDPMLLDRRRHRLSAGLDTQERRIERERLALRLAVGAATRRLVLSYPRVDTDNARPRVPSFYGLEVLRAGEGALPGLDALATRAREEANARMSWPAPARADRALDETEYDLCVLEQLLHADRPRRGAAAYLLETNPHLARALRFRARRWGPKKWTPADGLVDPDDPAAAALAGHRLGARPYSATALQRFATCPYQFYLGSILRLEPREVPAPIDDLDALQRGSLIHEAQRRVLATLREHGQLPLRSAHIDEAIATLDRVLDELADETREELVPAIERVWRDSIEQIRRDLRQWLRTLADQPWVPTHFELAFGLPDTGDRDPQSRPEPAALDCGITLRGSIDLVERQDRRLRATDHKTGRKPDRNGLVIDGGAALQPVLYALALEALHPDTPVAGGRLSFCTERGQFAELEVPLDQAARDAATVVARAVDGAIAAGFLPAAPRDNACRYCDYLAVCGPYEELRTRRKDRQRISALEHLREQP